MHLLISKYQKGKVKEIHAFQGDSDVDTGPLKETCHEDLNGNK